MLLNRLLAFLVYEENLLVTLARTVFHTCQHNIPIHLPLSEFLKREREVPTAIVLTVQRNNANNEPNAQHHDNERVDLEAGALVGVQLEHGRAATAGAGGASA